MSQNDGGIENVRRGERIQIDRRNGKKCEEESADALHERVCSPVAILVECSEFSPTATV